MTFNEHDLKEIVENLKNNDDFFWGNYIIKKDPIYGKLDGCTKCRMIEDSIMCAHDTYDRLINEHGRLTAEEYAGRLGIKIDEDDEISDAYPCISIYNADPPLIRISSSIIDEIHKYMEVNGVYGLLGKDGIREIAISHELFHHLEEIYSNIYTRKRNVEIYVLKIIKCKVCAMSTSEIAAVSFSKLLAGIEYSPCIYEILLLLSRNKGCISKVLNKL